LYSGQKSMRESVWHVESFAVGHELRGACPVKKAS
jgi:hypothetical protein